MLYILHLVIHIFVFYYSQLDETFLERLWGLTEMFPDTLRSAAEVSANCSLSVGKRLYSFSRAALWVGTTSFMILVLPVVFETERLQLEQQQLQQQRQVGMSDKLRFISQCLYMFVCFVFLVKANSDFQFYL
ncbi:hypothetical protein P4O66_010825, partial [Electrophorus voltai]